MSTDELAEALKRQKAGFVPTEFLVMLSKLLEVDEAIVARITYAYDKLQQHVPAGTMESVLPFWTRHMPRELMDAIKLGVEQGANGTYIARAIMASSTMTLDVELLLPAERVHEICNGCSERIECMADSLHTPQECYEERKSRVTVFPLRMTKTDVTVEAQQPRGTYTVPVSKIRQPFTR